MNRLYVQFREKYKPPKAEKDKAEKYKPESGTPDEEPQQDKAEELGRVWLKKLEAGDAIVTALWQRFRDVSWAEFEEIYKILDITYADLKGESHFWKQGDQAVEELRARNLLVESKGAQVVFHEGEKQPFIALTKDGTTL